MKRQLLKDANDESAVIVLGIAQSLLDSVPTEFSSQCLPLENNNNIEGNWAPSTIGDLGSSDGTDPSRAISRLVGQLRINALKLESDLSPEAKSIGVAAEWGQSRYRFTTFFRLGEQGEVERVVGAVVGDDDGLVALNPEVPGIIERLFAEGDCSVTDRVRVLSQLVCLYCDAIRFGGFFECPLGDAVSALRLAVGELRKEYAADAGDDSGDSGSDGKPVHGGESMGDG